ncbi:hypothetical protein PARHAE_03563 [Paracoccus haematequi]|uniref:HTH-like domain-containing protein n=1 Tax=Paracoccus haematequi TaxID=2491866 RepID=A0A447IS68_9RHOB|nr:hypothetical protein PARHAE_03563 [Paracoccus haematequi]
MKARFREQHRLSLGSYGRPRMTEELNEPALRVGKRRVGRLMRQNGIPAMPEAFLPIWNGRAPVR